MSKPKWHWSNQPNANEIKNNIANKLKGKHFSSKTEFKKGHIPWHKGKKTGIIPKNSFLKGSIPWNKDIKRIDIAGKKHWNWRGGITPKILKLRRSFEYKQWRKKVFERDNYTCQSCGKRGGKLEADHIFPFSVLIAELKKIFESNFEEIIKCNLLWEIKNGRTLCKLCHSKTPTYMSKAKNYEIRI